MLQGQQDGLGRRGGLERRPSGQHVIEDRPQAVDVARRTDLDTSTEGQAPGLLGGHVAGRAHERPRGGERRIDVDPLGQAEVADIRVPLEIDQDIRRLEVAVQDAAFVGVVDRPADRHQQSGRFEGRQRAFGELLRQRRPLDVLHGEIRMAVAFSDLQDRDDVRVRQPRRGLGFGPEPLDVLRRRLGPAQEPLQRHNPAPRHFSRPRHDPHAAPAELLE